MHLLIFYYVVFYCTSLAIRLSAEDSTVQLNSYKNVVGVELSTSKSHTFSVKGVKIKIILIIILFI